MLLRKRRPAKWNKSGDRVVLLDSNVYGHPLDDYCVNAMWKNYDSKTKWGTVKVGSAFIP